MTESLSEQVVSLTFDELVVLSGLVVGHRINKVKEVPDSHWDVLQKLHEKLCQALASCLDELKAAGYELPGRPIKPEIHEMKPEVNGNNNGGSDDKLAF